MDIIYLQNLSCKVTLHLATNNSLSHFGMPAEVPDESRRRFFRSHEGDRSFSHESLGIAPLDFVEDMMINVIFRNISRVHTLHTHRLINLNFCPLVVSSKMSRCLVWQFSFTSDFIHISWQASWHTNAQF